MIDRNWVNSPEIKNFNTTVSLHKEGKYYFELTINYSEIVKIGPLVLAVGVANDDRMVGRLYNIRNQDAGKAPITIGIATDLDNGKLYISHNGMWIGGVPGSNQGLDIKLGDFYWEKYTASADSLKPYLESGALAPNVGNRPFAYAMPAGYQPWRGEHTPVLNIIGFAELEQAIPSTYIE